MSDRWAVADTVAESDRCRPVQDLDRAIEAPGLLAHGCEISADRVVLASGLKPARDLVQRIGRVSRADRAAQAASIGKRGIREAVRNGTTLLTHATGAGKTMSFALSMAALRGGAGLRYGTGAFSFRLNQGTGSITRSSGVAGVCHLRSTRYPESVSQPRFNADDYLSGGDGLQTPGRYFARLTLCFSDRTGWEPDRDPTSSFGAAPLDDACWRVNLSDLARAFVLSLIELWRKADPARFARTLALQLRTGRVWTVFRPASPPGQLMMASGHVTRGPNVARMTQVLVVRGEPLVSL